MGQGTGRPGAMPAPAQQSEPASTSLPKKGSVGLATRSLPNVLGGSDGPKKGLRWTRLLGGHWSAGRAKGSVL